MTRENENDYEYEMLEAEDLQEYRGGKDPWKSDMPEERRKNVALELLGNHLYGSAQYWHRYALKFLHEPFDESSYPHKNYVYDWDKRMKETLGELTEEQKSVLGELINKVCSGVGHTILSGLDQSPFEGSCRLAYDDWQGNTTVFDPEPYALHELWHHWAELWENMEKENS